MSCARPSSEPLLSDVGRKPQSVGRCGVDHPWVCLPHFPWLQLEQTQCWSMGTERQSSAVAQVLKQGIFLVQQMRIYSDFQCVHQFFRLPFRLILVWAFICLRKVLWEFQTCADETDAAWKLDWGCHFFQSRDKYWYLISTWEFRFNSCVRCYSV